VQEIAAQIHQACVAITQPYAVQTQAKQDLDGASTALTNVRLGVCRNIAKLAHDNDWDDAYLDDAVKLAQATPGSNDAQTKKAVEVFCSQVKACARPRVRGNFATIADAIAHAWAIEKQAMALAKDKKETADTPLRKFVSREYEMVLRACREINEGKTGLKITCAEDVFAWARENDPDFDAERVAKRLKALAVALHEFYQNFPSAKVNDAKQAIASIAAVDLVAARNAMLAAENAKRQAIPLAPIPPVIQARIDAPSAEPAEGVFDVDATMNDAALLAIAA
jgi:hypothetical protein